MDLIAPDAKTPRVSTLRWENLEYGEKTGTESENKVLSRQI